MYAINFTKLFSAHDAVTDYLLNLGIVIVNPIVLSNQHQRGQLNKTQ